MIENMKPLKYKKITLRFKKTRHGVQMKFKVPGDSSPTQDIWPTKIDAINYAKSEIDNAIWEDNQ